MDTLNDYDDDDSSEASSGSGHDTANDTSNDTPPQQQPPPVTSQRLQHIQTQQQQQQQQPWIQQLQAQPEFHNPHFFQAVVEHFGIDALGTHVVQISKPNSWSVVKYTN